MPIPDNGTRVRLHRNDKARESKLTGLNRVEPRCGQRNSGGGGDRTRVSSDVTTLNDNDLRQRIRRLAALWLQSGVSDEHDLARIVVIAEAWTALPEIIKLEIEACSRITNTKVELPSVQATRTSFGQCQ